MVTMELTGLALAYHLRFLEKELVNGHVNKIQELENGFLRFKVHTKNGSLALVLGDKSIYVTSFVLPAKKVPTHPAVILKKYLNNRKIISFSQNNLDRSCVIEFSEYRLFCEFFPENNLILTDKENKILFFRKQFSISQKKLKHNTIYEQEQTRGNPQKTSAKNVIEATESKNMTKTLANTIGTAPALIETALKEARIKKKEQDTRISPQKAQKIADKIREVHEINEEKYFPVLLGNYVYPIDMKTPTQKKLSSINAFLDEYNKPLFETKGNEETKKDDFTTRTEKSIEQQFEAKKRLEDEVKKNQLKGELIYSHYSDLDELIGCLKRAVGVKKTEKEIMYTLKMAANKGNTTAAKIKSVDLKRKEFVAELH
jgi:predicted ribosome quality control (RQC) complex YloA/Tae2 family protein